MKIIKEMVEMFPIRKRPIYGLCKSLWLALVNAGYQLVIKSCV